MSAFWAGFIIGASLIIPVAIGALWLVGKCMPRLPW